MGVDLRNQSGKKWENMNLSGVCVNHVPFAIREYQNGYYTQKSNILPMASGLDRTVSIVTFKCFYINENVDLNLP